MFVRLLLVLATWAAFYLPWLGGHEYYSEEGHRVMPALEMMQSGDYLVPRVAGQLYFNKPPLINWLIIASFRCFGVSEWSARFVSAVAVLAGALLFLLATRREFGRNGALVAAVAWLTNFALIEKGRMAEIEAVYAALFAFALVAWLELWRNARSPWLTWTVPFVFLGLGLLAKGPAHLLFFYCIVVAVLWKARRLKELLRLPHLAGLTIAIAIFAAWAVPYKVALRDVPVSKEWSHEVLSPVFGHYHVFRGWEENFPRGFGYFMPWVVLLAFVRSRLIKDERDRRIAQSVIWGASIPWFLLLLLPYTYPRYVIPLLAPMCWCLGLAWREHAFEWRLPKLAFRLPPALIGGFIAVICLGALILWPPYIHRRLVRKPKLKARAAQINQHVAANDLIYVWDPSFQPYLLYVQAPLRYLPSLSELPADARYLITSSDNWKAMQKEPRWAGSPIRLVQETASYREITSVLLQLKP